MTDQNRIDEPTGTEFVGHEWDGIEELNTPLPRWWLWTFYATVAFSAVYVVLYPAWPLVEKATAGTLGWSSRGELSEEMASAEASRAEVYAQIAATEITDLADNPELLSQAISGGAAAFKQHCVQCHGQGAAGYEEYGYPNLNDDDWIWGGDLNEIEYTLTHGIRWDGSDETRISLMPAFAGMFEGGQVDALVSHVQSLSGEGAGSAAGAQIFADNCAVCHGADGAIWLYGNTEASIRQQILAPRHGVMPGWSDKLDPVTIRMLAAYVHSRGGGEEAEVEAPVEETATPGGEVAQAQEEEGNGQL